MKKPSSGGSAVIQLDGLIKTFDGYQAVNDVSLEVRYTDLLG
ncbi:hypothetical protein EDD76_1038 [Kineothrix alysoides]|uniref:Uncharacterized protein n=1 Tax=Kineothrix alysoides TaxID=1469948 RepID=A0A4R1R3D4_9FIRM|nr:hypothetical protein [Kineothrix alysoides]TCL59822.1 hypothetical protein EDD76_1038 [Kineothrix alysoides]